MSPPASRASRLSSHHWPDGLLFHHQVLTLLSHQPPPLDPLGPQTPLAPCTRVVHPSPTLIHGTYEDTPGLPNQERDAVTITCKVSVALKQQTKAAPKPVAAQRVPRTEDEGRRKTGKQNVLLHKNLVRVPPVHTRNQVSPLKTTPVTECLASPFKRPNFQGRATCFIKCAL